MAGIDSTCTLFIEFKVVAQNFNNMENLKKEHTAHFYPGANHGFHNNTTPRYAKVAADLAWERTIAFFRKKLR
ncbi:MAG: dienelactone hydrolase family protein [Bacteroidota bacterium]|nr:dienelactone hydrolase family protein [Bacteroidota bacterium]